MNLAPAFKYLQGLPGFSKPEKCVLWWAKKELKISVFRVKRLPGIKDIIASVLRCGVDSKCRNPFRQFYYRYSQRDVK